MTGLKRYLVVLLLGLFVVGSMAGAAMAHCDHSVAGSHGPGMTMDGTMDAGDAGGAAVHGHPADAGAHDCHDSAAQPAEHPGGDGHASACHNCDGSLCQSPTIAPEPAVLGHSASASCALSEDTIHIRTITLAVIPDPPKQLS